MAELTPIPAGIPAALKAERRWILWRAVPRPGKPKPDKVPVSVAGHAIDRHEAACWLTFDDARAANRFDGLGFVLGGGFVGYDHDGCRDPRTGAIAPEVQDVIDALDSYTETSPSGTGIHIIARGALPVRGRRKHGHELYDDQFFTVTGDHVAGTPVDVQDRAREIAALHARIFGVTADAVQESIPSYIREGDTRGTENIPAPIVLTDEDLIARAFAAANGAKFRRLYGGDWSGYASQSEADMALCRLLAFWTGRDAARVDVLFRRSGLFRPKWDERRGITTLGARNIARAIATTADVYEPLPVADMSTVIDLGGAPAW